MILLYGTYPLVCLKSVWLYFLAGICGAFMVFFSNTKNKIGGFFVRFFIGAFTAFIVVGVLRDYLQITPKEYLYSLIGFLSYPLFNFVLRNIDHIVESLFGKVLDKLGIDLKDDEEDAQQ